MDLGLIIFTSLAMFSIAVLGVLLKRNILIFFLSIEMMLNAGNLLFVAFARHHGNEVGLVWVFFVLVVAAAEAAIGFAIIIHAFRSKNIVDIDRYQSLKG